MQLPSSENEKNRRNVHHIVVSKTTSHISQISMGSVGCIKPKIPTTLEPCRSVVKLNDNLLSYFSSKASSSFWRCGQRHVPKPAQSVAISEVYHCNSVVIKREAVVEVFSNHRYKLEQPYRLFVWGTSPSQRGWYPRD